MPRIKPILHFFVLVMMLISSYAAISVNAQANKSVAQTKSHPISKLSTDPWGTFTQISAGGNFSCALNGSGNAYCWGLNDFGTLGNGSATNTVSNRIPTLVTMPAGVTFTTISTSDATVCAITTIGTAYCWGYNNYGQLGDGTTTNRSTPVAVSMPAGVTFASISAGGAHTCALTSAGAAYCWGANSSGEIGNGTNNNSNIPTAITMPVGTTFTAITTGGNSGRYFTCAISTSNNAYCWGNNLRGYLGNGTTTDSNIPTAMTMPTGTTFTAIDAGSESVCALTATNIAYCWGSGHLGNGTVSQQTTPVAVTMPTGITFSSVETGSSHTCAFSTGNIAYCWGDNNFSQLGDGTRTARNIPVAVSMPSGVTFASISTGLFHNCGLTSAGIVYCWGMNEMGSSSTNEQLYGSLGNCLVLSSISLPTNVGSGCAPASTSTATNTNTRTRTNTRTSTSTNTRTSTNTPSRTLTSSATPTSQSNPWGSFTQVSAGSEFSCALNGSGNAYCWGVNEKGQLGNGTTTSSNIPTLVTMPAGITFATIYAGNTNACAITTIGTAYCWGYNYYGQLGDGTTTDSHIPSAVTMPVGTTFTTISTRDRHSCALSSTGTAYCWGANNNGQFGNGTTSDSNIPTAITMPVSTTFTAITTGGNSGRNFTCAISTSNNAYCWGNNLRGYLGNGTTTDSTIPTAVTMPAGTTFTAIAAGSETVCALTATNIVYCWGSGDLGNGTPSQQTTPVAVTMPTGITFNSINNGSAHTCALSASNNVYCWGANSFGQLGNGTNTNSNIPTTVTMPAGITFISISAGDFHNCGLTSSGIVYCWGNNDMGRSSTNEQLYGSLGNCSRNLVIYIPTRVGSGCTSTATNTRTATSTPTATNTRTATITRTASRTPTPPSYPWGIFTSINTGAYHTCAIATTGAAFCWGSNMFGQLGTGTTTWSATPTAVTMPTNVTFTAINAGFTHTCALTASGTAYCWGNNIFGQLGDGSTEDSTTPVAVVMPAGVTFVAIVVSTYHTCALTASGNVYCWGINRTNQLGNGTTTDSSVPLIVTMPTGITFSSIATSGYSTCALTASGAAYCWGANTFGQLGIGSTSNAAVPTAVTMPTGITFVFISVGRYHTCALTASGAAYCWGLNLGGSLGNGTTTNSTVPVAVTMPSGITFDTISTGWNHTCALTAAGIAYCWGQNSGQVGDGSTTNRTTPMLVSMPTGMTFTDIMAGATHTCALAGNGLAYCWGTNTNGQLGLCNCITYTRPSQVGMACATNTATATITVTPSDTRTSTTTQTPSLTRTPTNTHTPSNTRTETNTPTNTRTPSKTRTYTPSNTATATPQQLALKKAAIGNLFVIGLLQDGTLVAWGKTTGSIIPSTLKGKTFIDVAATLDTVFALESDGTLRYFGACSDGLCTVPDDAKTDIIAIGAGARFAYAVRSDNTIIGWGKNDFAQVTIPSFATNIIAVDGGARHAVALRADGTVVGWGDNSLGQARQPDGLKNIVAVSAGEDHSCALSNVGEVICWGGGSKSAWGTIPKGTKDYIKIAAGRFCTLAIKADGTLMRWGKEDFSFTGQITDAIVVASDNQNSVVGLRNNGVRVAGSNFEGVFTTRTPTITPTP